jgi:hydrogenase expression/formation protein HypD
MPVSPDFYRGVQLSKKVLSKLKERSLDFNNLRLMEFCGTHTHNIFRYGFRRAFEPHIKFISGPGCPICVTSEKELEQAVYLIEKYDVGVIAYGDLVRVPVAGKSLADFRSEGKSVEIIYSAIESLDIAGNQPYKEWVFLGVGFETTIPGTAIAIDMAKKRGIKNLSFLSFHKNTRAVLDALGKIGELNANGIILPGHVSAVVGWDYFSRIEDFGKPAVVTGFDPLDILLGVNELLNMIEANETGIRNVYKRAVDKKGNRVMMEKVNEIFNLRDAPWRGLGNITEGGYELRGEFDDYNARKKFNLPDKIEYKVEEDCRCGDVLIGKIEPSQCPLFKTVCTPENPVGPCMVSHEGSCMAYYKYGDIDG